VDVEFFFDTPSLEQILSSLSKNSATPSLLFSLLQNSNCFIHDVDGTTGGAHRFYGRTTLFPSASCLLLECLLDLPPWSIFWHCRASFSGEGVLFWFVFWISSCWRWLVSGSFTLFVLLRFVATAVVLFGLLNGVAPVYISTVLLVDVVTVPFG
jgi:hypothetical protein